MTYNEPAISREYLEDAGELIHEAGLVNMPVTNGEASDCVIDRILPVMDGMNIDLKGFTDDIYKRPGGDLESVKQFINRSAEECHVEITFLIIIFDFLRAMKGAQIHESTYDQRKQERKRLYIYSTEPCGRCIK